MADRPAGAPSLPSPDRGAAREKLMAYLAWGVAEGAITQEQAGEELARFEAEATKSGDAG